MTTCKHGLILYGARCINCERERQQKQSDANKKTETEKRILEKAKQLDW